MTNLNENDIMRSNHILSLIFDIKQILLLENFKVKLFLLKLINHSLVSDRKTHTLTNENYFELTIIATI